MLASAHTHTCARVHVFVDVCMCVCVSVADSICSLPQTRTRTRTRTRTYSHAPTRTYVHHTVAEQERGYPHLPDRLPPGRCMFVWLLLSRLRLCVRAYERALMRVLLGPTSAQPSIVTRACARRACTPTRPRTHKPADYLTKLPAQTSACTYVTRFHACLMIIAT